MVTILPVAPAADLIEVNRSATTRALESHAARFRIACFACAPPLATMLRPVRRLLNLSRQTL
jgi:hypothetical protein